MGGGVLRASDAAVAMLSIRGLGPTTDIWIQSISYLKIAYCVHHRAAVVIECTVEMCRFELNLILIQVS